MVDPFHVEGPAVISFSGGRTSGYMLWRILEAHGGRLPDDVVVCFANTGREMPATLDFVRDCDRAWAWDGAFIHWLEYRRNASGQSYEQVGHNSASRSGEPFEQLLSGMTVLPNVIARNCTQQLKIKTVMRYVRSELGWKNWTNVVGLRADEPGRVHRAVNAKGQRWRVVCPLHDAGIVEADILAFWRQQSFDLRLNGKHEGNCDGCFLKRRDAISRMLREHPDRMAWWAQMEARARERFGDGNGAVFRVDRESYAEMASLVERQGLLPYSVFEPEMGCNEWACTD